MNNEILFTKDDFNFIKVNDSCYEVSFTLENNNIYLDEVIGYPFIKLIYDLNQDIFERMEMKVNKKDDKAEVIIVVRDLFEDIGLAQFYAYVNIENVTSERYKKVFKANSLLCNDRPDIVPKEAECLPIMNFDCEYHSITPHKIECRYTVEIKENINNNVSVSFLEKMVGKILFKLFGRIKTFIQNVNVMRNDVNL
jgi:hypothetical protein